MAPARSSLGRLGRALMLVVLVAFDHPTSSAPFVDVPARHLRDGARTLVGMNPLSDVQGTLSPDGTLLALAGGEDGVQLIDVGSGRGVAWRKDLACHEPDPHYVGPCMARVVFSPDGAHLWVWFRLPERLMRLAVPSAQTEAVLPVQGVHDLVPLMDGRVVALRNQDSTVVDAAGKAQRFFAHKDSAYAVSADGRQIVLEEADRFRVYDVATRELVSSAPETSLRAPVGFLPDGRGWVASRLNSNGYPDVVMWRVGDKVVRVLAASASGGGDVVANWAFPPPHTDLWVSMKQAGILRVSLDGKVTPFGSRGFGGSVVSRKDGYVLHNDTCAERVDLAGALLPGIQLCGVRPSALAFDGALLVAQPWGTGSIERFDSKTGGFVSMTDTALPMVADSATLQTLSRDERVRARVLVGLSLPGVEHGPFSLSNNGRWLFLGSRGQAGGASIVDLDTMQARTKLTSFFAAPDGSIVLQELEDSERTFEVRRVADHALVRKLTLDLEPLYVRLSPNGKRLVVQSMDKTEVIDVTTGRKLFEPACRSSYTGGFEFSLDGAWLVCDTMKETVVYDIASRRVLRRFVHPENEAADSFALSDDKRHLAVAADGLRIFDL